MKKLKEYVEDMKEHVENMKEYVKNTKKYVENMKEYEEIIMSIYGILHSHIYMGLGTNFKLYPYIDLYRLWDLEKFHTRASS